MTPLIHFPPQYFHFSINYSHPKEKSSFLRLKNLHLLSWWSSHSHEYLTYPMQEYHHLLSIYQFIHFNSTQHRFANLLYPHRFQLVLIYFHLPHDLVNLVKSDYILASILLHFLHYSLLNAHFLLLKFYYHFHFYLPPKNFTLTRLEHFLLLINFYYMKNCEPSSTLMLCCFVVCHHNESAEIVYDAQ